MAPQLIGNDRGSFAALELVAEADPEGDAGQDDFHSLIEMPEMGVRVAVIARRMAGDRDSRFHADPPL